MSRMCMQPCGSAFYTVAKSVSNSVITPAPMLCKTFCFVYFYRPALCRVCAYTMDFISAHKQINYIKLIIESKKVHFFVWKHSGLANQMFFTLGKKNDSENRDASRVVSLSQVTLSLSTRAVDPESKQFWTGGAKSFYMVVPEPVIWVPITQT